MCGPSPTCFCSVSKNLGRTGDATPRMFSNELRKPLLRVVTFEQFGNFNRFCRFVQRCVRWSDLTPSHHISADNREERCWTRANNWPELLLQNLQQVTFRKVHLKNGMKLVILGVRFGADGHRQRDEVLRDYIWHPDDHRLEFNFGRGLGQQPLQIVGMPSDSPRGDVVKVLAFLDELLEFRQQAIPPDKGSNDPRIRGNCS
jgi:hypothetical protein